MKIMLILLALLVVPGLYFWQAQGSSSQRDMGAAKEAANLERRIERILLYEPRTDATGEVYDPAVEIEKLEQKPQVRAILSKMVKQHRYADLGTAEYRYFEGVLWVAGSLGLREISETLTQVLLDPFAEGSIRVLAAKSLGQIDVEGNKEILLSALNSSVAENDDLVRAAAAEALAATKDTRVLNELETRASQEDDKVIRERIEASARKLRARIASQKN